MCEHYTMYLVEYCNAGAVVYLLTHFLQGDAADRVTVHPGPPVTHNLSRVLLEHVFLLRSVLHFRFDLIQVILLLTLEFLYCKGRLPLTRLYYYCGLCCNPKLLWCCSTSEIKGYQIYILY